MSFAWSQIRSLLKVSIVHGASTARECYPFRANNPEHIHLNRLKSWAILKMGFSKSAKSSKDANSYESWVMVISEYGQHSSVRFVGIRRSKGLWWGTMSRTMDGGTGSVSYGHLLL